MTKKKKLDLDSLKIMSFVTTDESKAKDLKGGLMPDLTPGNSCVYTDGDACANCYAFCDSSCA